MEFPLAPAGGNGKRLHDVACCVARMHHRYRTFYLPLFSSYHPRKAQLSTFEVGACLHGHGPPPLEKTHGTGSISLITSPRSDSHRSKLRTLEVFFRPSIAATTMSGAHSIWILQNWIFDIVFCNMHAWIDIWFGILGKLKEKWSREWLACPSQLHDACKLLDITNGTA